MPGLLGGNVIQLKGKSDFVSERYQLNFSSEITIEKSMEVQFGESQEWHCGG